MTVNPGRSLALTVLTPEGKAWTRALGLQPHPFDQGSDLPDGRGVILALAEGEQRRVFLQTTDEKYAGVLVLSGQETEPITVRLQPTGVISGRLLDAAGQPLAGRAFQILYEDGPRLFGVFFSREGVRQPLLDARR